MQEKKYLLKILAILL